MKSQHAVVDCHLELAVYHIAELGELVDMQRIIVGVQLKVELKPVVHAEILFLYEQSVPSDTYHILSVIIHYIAHFVKGFVIKYR